MPKEKKQEPNLFDEFDELFNVDDFFPPTTAGVENESSFNLSQELDEIFATFVPDESTRSDGDNIKGESVHLDRLPTYTGIEKDNGAGYLYHLRWRVAIINKWRDQNDIYHGHTQDISLTGVSVLIDHNISFTSEVIVLLAIPPVILGQKETILEVQCSSMYTLLDSEHHQFRLGMKFVKFKGEGKRILRDLLSKRPIPKNTERSYSVYT